MRTFCFQSTDKLEQPEPLQRPRKRKSPPNFEFRSTDNRSNGYHSGERKGWKKRNTYGRCGTGRGANSMERTVRVPDAVEETRFADEVNRTLKGRHCTNYRKKIALESTGAMKAQPARTSHNNQLELALHRCRNLQICSWNTNKPS